MHSFFNKIDHIYNQEMDFIDNQFENGLLTRNQYNEKVQILDSRRRWIQWAREAEKNIED